MKRTSTVSTTSDVPAKKATMFNCNNDFSADSIPPHYYHLGDENYAVVSDFNDSINVHIRKFRTDVNGCISPTKNGVNFTPFIWQSLVAEMDNLSFPSTMSKVVIIRDSLFLSTAWIENTPHVSLQSYVTKANFSRQFLPSVCVLTAREWDRLQCISKTITESYKTLMFGEFFKKRILNEVSMRSHRSHIEMELDDVNMILSTSLTEILSLNLKNRIEDVLVCYECIENQANQLGHECITMNYESRHGLYGDISLFSIEIDLAAKDFIEKNIEMLNYINENFLQNLNMNLLLKNVCETYISLDPMPYR